MSDIRVLLCPKLLVRLFVFPKRQRAVNDIVERSILYLRSLIDSERIAVFIPYELLLVVYRCLDTIDTKEHMIASVNHLIRKSVSVTSAEIDIYKILLDSICIGKTQEVGDTDMIRWMLYTCNLNIDGLVCLPEDVSEYTRALQLINNFGSGDEIEIVGDFGSLSYYQNYGTQIIPVTNIPLPRIIPISVYTPAGDCIELPNEATPIDFAYKIHTQVGNKCIGAKVNNQIVPLHSPLKHGDRVEIFKDDDAQPSQDWLFFVKTDTARNGISRALRDLNIRKGRKLLEAMLGRDFQSRDCEFIYIARRLDYRSANLLFKALGNGEIDITRIQEAISTYELEILNRQLNLLMHNDVLIVGEHYENMHLAHCCTPMPCDEIVGVSNGESRITIHRKDCFTLESVQAEYQILLSGFPNQIWLLLEIRMIDRDELLTDIGLYLRDIGIKYDIRNVKTYPDKTTAKLDLWVRLSNRSDYELIANSLIQNLQEIRRVRVLRARLDCD